MDFLEELVTISGGQNPCLARVRRCPKHCTCEVTIEIQWGEGVRWVGQPAAWSLWVRAVEEAVAVVGVLDFQESPPRLAGLQREGPGGSGRAGCGGRLGAASEMAEVAPSGWWDTTTLAPFTAAL